jgi:monovalent cation/hydrogen antiporter
MPPVRLLDLILLLMAFAVVLALVARRLRIPPAVAFVPGGMVLALTPGVPAFQLDPALSLTLFLPPLIQAGAFFTVWRDFRANLRPILLLAVGAVAFTTLVVGWVMKLLQPDLPWAACFTLGAIVSPPDAVAAGAVLERLRLPRQLLTVLEGESLVNDATGLVLYRFAAAAALGGAFDIWHATASFVLVVAAGIAVGYACGVASIWLLQRLHDTNLEITASFLAAWASYITAEMLGASGVLATVACGLVLGWRQHETFSPETRQEARAAWRFVIFVLQAIVFVLIGLSLRGVLGRLGMAHTLALLPLAVTVTAAAIAARFVWVFPGTYVPRVLWPPLRRRDPVASPKIPLIVAWSGMRGVVSLAAALALPDGFPGRDPILLVTFVVILGTVMLQGPTLGPLILALKLGGALESDVDPVEAETRAALARVALAVIEERSRDPLSGAMALDLLGEYRDRAGRAARRPGGAAARAAREAHLALRLEAATAARNEVLRRHRASEIHDEVLRKLERELDLEELQFRKELGG